jgi:hypothetical protein
VLLIESGFRLYDNSTLNLDLIFPVLFGAELADLSILDDIKTVLQATIHTITGGAEATLDLLTATLDSLLDVAAKRHKIPATEQHAYPTNEGLLGYLLSKLHGGSDPSSPTTTTTTTTTTTDTGSRYYFWDII